MSLVCYDVSSDSDNEMECTENVKIKLEPLEDSPDLEDQENYLNDNSFVNSGNDCLLSVSDASSSITTNLNDNNSLQNITTSPLEQIAQNNIHEINSDAHSKVFLENHADKNIYRQPEAINLSSDSEEDSSESASSDESATDETDDKSEELEVIKQPVVKPAKKKAKDPFAEEMNFPPIEDLQISIEEDQAKSIGTIFQIIDNQVVVQAFPNIPPIDIDSVLFLESGKRALGKVFDVFGNIHEPLYVVIFNTAGQVTEKGIETGQSVYFAPASNEHTSYVIMDELLRAKGSDASWKDNREPPPNYVEFSDDEEERRAKQSYKHSKMAQKGLDANSEVVCCNADEESSKYIKRENYNKMRLPQKYDQSNKSRTYWRNQSQNLSKYENIFSKGPPQYGSKQSEVNHNRFRNSAELSDQSNNVLRPRFGGPPQFPTPPPPPSYSSFLGPPPSPAQRSTPSPNVCSPYLCSSPGPPQLWHGSMSPLPLCPPPAISHNPSSFYRNINQEPPTLFQVPPPHYTPLRGNGSVHETNSIMHGENISCYGPQPYTSNLHSQTPTSTVSPTLQYPPPVHNKFTPTTIKSHTGSPPIFCPQRPPPVTPSHCRPPQVLPPHLPITHQLMNQSVNFLPQGPPPALTELRPSSTLLLQTPARAPSPFLLLQRSPPPQMQQVKEPSQQFLQFQMQPPQLMSVQGHMPPNIHPVSTDIPSQMLPPAINYRMPPANSNLTFKACPPPQMSSSQGPPPLITFSQGPPPQLMTPSQGPPPLLTSRQGPPPRMISSQGPPPYFLTGTPLTKFSAACNRPE